MGPSTGPGPVRSFTCGSLDNCTEVEGARGGGEGLKDTAGAGELRRASGGQKEAADV